MDGPSIRDSIYVILDPAGENIRMKEHIRDTREKSVSREAKRSWILRFLFLEQF